MKLNTSSLNVSFVGILFNSMDGFVNDLLASSVAFNVDFSLSCVDTGKCATNACI